MTFQEGAAIGIALVACGFDLRTARIPNWLTLGAAVAAVVVAALLNGAVGVAISITAWTVATLFWIPLYALGGMGAGDVKLIAALGAWLGLSEIVHVALYAMLAGAAMAIAVAAARGCAGQMLRNVRLLLTHWRVVGFAPYPQLTLASGKNPRLAYAVPVFAGTVTAIWLQ